MIVEGQWNKILKILFKIEKAAKNNDGCFMCHVFSLEDAVAHVTISDPSGILIIEK